MEFETRCIHGSEKTYDNTGALCTPIFQSATFSHPAVGKSTGYDYSRIQNPTREHLEEVVASLEQGCDAIAFSSGMAALTAMMVLFSPGDHLIVADDLYGGSYRLFAAISEKNGIRFSRFARAQEVEALIEPQTKAVFIETPTNPMMQVIDIAAVCRIAQERGLLVAVDNTFLTPYFQRPLTLGADIVLHSGTKYLGGHNDTLAGFLILRDSALAQRLRYLAKTTGACLSPFDSFLIERGIKTLPVRLERQQETALRLAAWLGEQEAVEQVYYPGLHTHPDYAISRAQSSGFGGMLSFRVRSAALAVQVLERVRVIAYAESLGGVESLITYPMLQTHADIPEQERLAKGIDGALLRLSVGLEAAADLIADLQQAFYGGE